MSKSEIVLHGILFVLFSLNDGGKKKQTKQHNTQHNFKIHTSQALNVTNNSPVLI